jgi:hypothetical protein
MHIEDFEIQEKDWFSRIAVGIKLNDNGTTRRVAAILDRERICTLLHVAKNFLVYNADMREEDKEALDRYIEKIEQPTEDKTAFEKSTIPTLCGNEERNDYTFNTKRKERTIMNFLVRFETKEKECHTCAGDGHYKRAVSIPKRQTGTEDLIRVRKETREDAPMWCLEGYVPRLLANVVIKVSEQDAMKVPHFAKSNDIKVFVPEASMNKYVDEVVSAERDPVNGEVRSAELIQAVDEEKVFKAWGEAGYPLEWDGREVPKTMPEECNADADANTAGCEPSAGRPKLTTWEDIR